MRYVKLVLGAVLFATIAGFFHYNLPSRDIVRIVNTDVVRMDFTARDANGEKVIKTRDQMRIYAIRPNGHERVYRNEDTGWGFPWYFKFDSADLAARAENLKSTEADPRWVVVTHYGWRVTYLSWFPNAISIRPAEGPDEDLTPWFNIVFITTLVLAVLIVRRFLLILFRRHVDPVIDEIDREIDETSGWLRRQWRRFRRGVAGLFGL